ncbi:MAG: glycosyltransferase family 2 protein [Phycisphaerae bacterium]|nr:glycosyltransferase family 2 protein [Phycisphaerae bacterium]
MTTDDSKEPEPSGTGPSVSVFFPCFNEQDNIRALVEKTLKTLEPLNTDFEIVIVNDGSSDRTREVADALADTYEPVRVIHHDTNLGYGAALQSGFRGANKDLIFYTDGDGQFDIAELPPLLDLIRDCDIVSCYRLNRQDPLIRKINGWCWTRLVCLVFGLRLRDIDCAFKLYKREVFEGMPLCSTGALIDTEVMARATRKGCRIVQRGVHHYPRTAGMQTGANLRVVLRAFVELFHLRKRILKGD